MTLLAKGEIACVLAFETQSESTTNQCAKWKLTLFGLFFYLLGLILSPLVCLLWPLGMNLGLFLDNFGSDSLLFNHWKTSTLLGRLFGQHLVFLSILSLCHISVIFWSYFAFWTTFPYFPISYLLFVLFVEFLFFMSIFSKSVISTNLYMDENVSQWF